MKLTKGCLVHCVSITGVKMIERILSVGVDVKYSRGGEVYWMRYEDYLDLTTIVSIVDFNTYLHEVLYDKCR